MPDSKIYPSTDAGASHRASEMYLDQTQSCPPPSAGEAKSRISLLLSGRSCQLQLQIGSTRDAENTPRAFLGQTAERSQPEMAPEDTQTSAPHQVRVQLHMPRGWEQRSSFRGHRGGTELEAGQIYILPLGACPPPSLLGKSPKGVQPHWP